MEVKFVINIGFQQLLERAIQKSIPEINAATKLIVVERFLKKRNPKGKPWSKLKQSTLKSSQYKTVRSNKNRNKSDVLIDTGQLFNSIYTLPNKGIVNNKVKCGVYIGALYGQYHQYGTKRKGKMTLPSESDKGWRGFLGFNKKNQAEIKGILRRNIQQALKEFN